MHQNVIYKDFTSQHNVIIQLVYVGVLISMALNLQIHVQEENQIVVGNIYIFFDKFLEIFFNKNFKLYFFAEEVINKAASIISDDEDDETDEEDSAEGSADNLLVF